MKKIIKKLGVIGLLLAVLIPFMSFPKVNAANDGECKKHLQNYLFLDVEQLFSKNSFDGFDNDGKGYTTTTQFPFEFDKNAKITNISYDGVASDKVSNYVTLHNIAITRDIATSTYQFYRGSSIYGNAFVNNTSKDYATNTILLHGQWSNSNAHFNPIENNWSNISNLDVFSKYVLQNSSLKADMNVEVGFGKYTKNGDPKAVEPSGTKMSVSSLQDIVSDPEAADDNGLLLWDDANEKYFLPISITRKMTDGYANDIKNSKFGMTMGSNGDIYVFGIENGGSTTKEKITNTKDSYENYLRWIKAGGDGVANCYDTEGTESGKKSCYLVEAGYGSERFQKDPSAVGVDFNVYGAYYWPYVMNVEYETCTTSNDPEEGNWNLIYDANADGDSSVTNVPDAVNNISFTSTVKIENGPSRDGYKFSKWCTKKDGTGDCYTAGVDFKNENQDPVVTLYAQWGKTGTTNNSRTGIASYIISFMAVGALAGGIYYVSKKKNLFKQI